MTQNELTPDQFQALVTQLKAYAQANPLNIPERVRSGLGPPLKHRRDFLYRDHAIRVLLTEDVLGIGAGARRAEHLSLMSLTGKLLPAPLLEEILAAFFPGCDQADLLNAQSVIPGCQQFIRLAPQRKEA